MDTTPSTTDRPLLIYDGDCGFCRYCVDYARDVTGPAVDYQPYQLVGSRFPAGSTALQDEGSQDGQQAQPEYPLGFDPFIHTIVCH